MIYKRSHFYPYDIIIIQTDAFINVIKRDPKVQTKNYILDNCIEISHNYQSKIGYDTLILNVILE